MRECEFINAKRPVSNLLPHNFPENGVKFHLQHPDNLRDLLATGNRTFPDPRGENSSRFLGAWLKASHRTNAGEELGRIAPTP